MTITDTTAGRDLEALGAGIAGQGFRPGRGRSPGPTIAILKA
jgi:hypothetical protein